MRQFDTPGDPTDGWPTIAGFVRARSKDILATWMLTTRGRPAAKEVPESSLIVRVSPLLDWLAKQEGSSRDMASLGLLADELAGARLTEGVDLREVLAQYSILRDCLIRMWGESATPHKSWPGMIAIHQVLDTAAAAAIAQFERIRDRTL